MDKQFDKYWSKGTSDISSHGKKNMFKKLTEFFNCNS